MEKDCWNKEINVCFRWQHIISNVWIKMQIYISVSVGMYAIFKQSNKSGTFVVGWHYMHGLSFSLDDFIVYVYPCVTVWRVSELHFKNDARACNKQSWNHYMTLIQSMEVIGF